jgi:low affinity Fe/Cu permease
MREQFRKFAEVSANSVGSVWAFALATAVVLVWGLTGPVFHYSDTWQLFINTGTTIVTFLIVFLIQNTQNRDARITALKLDELLRAVEGARTGLVCLDNMSDEELEHVRKQFARLQSRFAPLVADDLMHVEQELAERKTPKRRPKD